MTSFGYLQRAPNFSKQIWLLLSWTFYNVYAQRISRSEVKKGTGASRTCQVVKGINHSSGSIAIQTFNAELALTH